MLRITMTSSNVGADHAVRLAQRLASMCGGFRYTVMIPYARKWHKLELVTDKWDVQRKLLKLLAGDTEGWNRRVASRFLRTTAMVSMEFHQ